MLSFAETATFTHTVEFKIIPYRVLFWCTRTTPILEKTLRECRGKWKSFGWVRGNSGNRSESCSENCGFRIDQVVRGHSENGVSYSENGISNSESCSENTPELSESSENGPFAPRAFFLKLGWSPGFWFITVGPTIITLHEFIVPGLIFELHYICSVCLN